MKLTHAICAATLVVSSVASALATAQSIAEVSKSVDSLLPLEHRFAVARKNLHDVTKKLDKNTPEFLAAHEIVVTSGEVYGNYEAVALLGMVLQRGRCTDDFEVHQKVLDIAATDFIPVSERFLQETNELLPSIRNPAALDAATKLRDIVAEIQDVVSPFADTEKSTTRR